MLLIGFEGLPGSGKTTLIGKVAAYLQDSRGLRVAVVDLDTAEEVASLKKEAVRYPNGDPYRTFLFLALRLKQYEEAEKLAQEGETDVVLMDRTWWSSWMIERFCNRAPREMLEWALRGRDLPECHLVFFLDASLELAMGRKDSATLRDPEFAELLWEGYQELLIEHPWWIKLDAMMEPRDMLRQCVSHLRSRELLQAPVA